LPHKLSAKLCDERLKALGDKPTAVPIVLKALPSLPAPVPAAIDDGEVDGGDGGIAVTVDAAAHKSSSSSSSSTTSSNSSASEVDGDDAVEEFIPEQLQGAKVYREVHHQKGTTGLRMLCPLHAGCSKFRSFKLDVAQFGDRSASYFLDTWAVRATTMTRAAHKKWRPSRVEVREHIEKHGR
jgi:hypothetical protein